MSTWLKQSTAVEVAIGPFLDSADGNTIEDTLTITQPDIRLKKNGGAWAQKNAAQTLTHEEAGWYEISLDSTDTNTLGILIVAVHESGALPVWREFLVVTANIYDTFFSTDLLQVDLTQLLGSAVATPTVAGVPEVDVTHHLGTAVAAPTVAGVPKVDVSHYLGAAALALVNGRYSANVGSCSTGVIDATAIAAGAITSSELADGAITSTKFAAGAIGAAAINGDAITAAKIAADAITEIQTGLATASDLTIALSDLDNIQTRLPTSLVSGRIDASVGAIAANAVTATAINADAITAAKIAAGAIDAATLAVDMDTYHAKVWVTREGTTADHYSVTFYKNNQPLESGITSPLIDYVKKHDGTILVNDVVLVDEGDGDYFYSEPTNKLSPGSAYMSRVTATIGGSSRVFKQNVSRDLQP